MENTPNQLIHESSPYLLQHANNPVNWYPWGDEALKTAREEGKLILVSVGYAACHWCHVMAHKCFEDQEIADFMNAHFVNIKVDREERPDIDQIYMNAVMLINRSGGWPLNAFALPDGRPFFGGTYFPPERWLDLLKGIKSTYDQAPGRIEEYARQVQNGIKQTERIFQKEKEQQVTKKAIREYAEELATELDTKQGGTKGKPKFPLPSVWHFLLDYYFYYKDKDLLQASLTTLNKMAAGGIYDHVGGGFSRYSVDGNWRVPHFEKMLYDNGQLLSLYAKTYKLTGNLKYKNIVQGIADFLLRELRDESGAFYASLDADSEGAEGKFYLWQSHEIDEILGNDAGLFKDYYSVNTEGVWEGANILQISSNATRIILESGLSREAFAHKMRQNLNKLYEARSKRVRPSTDHKILTSWNALAIKGFVDAYTALNDERYLHSAKEVAEFITNHMVQENGLFRNYNGKTAEIPGFLDDYAVFINALTALYQAGFEEQWLHQARYLLKVVLEKFYDSQSGMFFYTEDEKIGQIERKMELSDNVLPSSNAVMAENLLTLGKLYYEDKWVEMARQMVANVAPYMMKNPVFYPAWAAQYLRLLHPPYEIAFTGANIQKVLKELMVQFYPNYVAAGKTKEDSSIPLLQDKALPESGYRLYPCINHVCEMPLDDLSQLQEKLKP